MPLAPDRERVAFARFQRRADLFERADPALDPARIDDQSQPRRRRVPQLFVDLQKWQLDVLAALVAQTNVVVDVPATHRRREVDVELEQVLRQRVGARIDMAKDRKSTRLNSS